MSNFYSFSFICFLLSSVITYSEPAHSEIYQWVDEHGQTHFSDRAPEKHKAKEISRQLESINISSELSSPEMMLKHEKMKDQEHLRQAADAQEKEKRQQQLSKACTEARQALKTLKGRVVFLDEQGKEISVSEAERQKQAYALEAAVRKHCS